ncbi:MAG: hypothetical protein HOP15_07030, partial [Planctomycetes bacterium]|nr:hypothetical protein [Planctomycetota bacterium]
MEPLSPSIVWLLCVLPVFPRQVSDESPTERGLSWRLYAAAITAAEATLRLHETDAAKR